MSKSATSISRFSVSVPIKDEDISSLVISAVEGGSNYWARFRILDKSGKEVGGLGRLPENLVGECRIIVEEFGDEGDLIATHELNLLDERQAKLGFERMLMPERCPIRHFVDVISENTDAVTADVFLQLCVLGEIRYG